MKQQWIIVSMNSVISQSHIKNLNRVEYMYYILGTDEQKYLQLVSWAYICKLQMLLVH